jgi:hypothetical protein
LANIFLRIQNDYGVTFTGSFFNLDQWKNLYLYLKQGLKMSFLSEQEPLNFTSIVTTSPFTPTFPEFNLTTDTLTTNWTWGSSIGNSQNFTVIVRITPAVGFTTIPYVLYTYKDGVLFSTITKSGVQDIQVDRVRRRNDPSLNHRYTFKLAVTATPFNYTSSLFYQKQYFSFAKYYRYLFGMWNL